MRVPSIPPNLSHGGRGNRNIQDSLEAVSNMTFRIEFLVNAKSSSFR